MNQVKPIAICLGLFAFPVLLVWLLTPFLASPVNKYLLESKENELLSYEIERNNLLEYNITSQLPKFNFNCGKKDMAVLRDPLYYNRYIRLAGIKSAQGKNCSTLGPGLAISKDVEDMPSETKFGISVTDSSTGTEQEFLVYSKHANNLVYWVINNSFIHDILMSPCPGCFYLEFTHYDPKLESIYIPRGDESIKWEAGAISVSNFDSLRKVEQKLWAGDRLLSYSLHQTRYYGLLISSAFGALLIVVYLLLRHHNKSLGEMIKLGLEREEFIPYYQPIVDSRTNDIVGYEALIRWRRKEELIPPGMFIDYAEQQGLIIPMTTQLVTRIVSDLKKLPPKQWVSVNLVAAHVEQQFLQHMLMSLQWPNPDRLTFELTERIPITNVNNAAREITELSSRGYKFKIDDFGTGYGGFSYLQQLGIRSIKIDKMFIDTIETDDLKQSVLDAIIAFGHESKMEMIAEGVETQEQLAYLAAREVYLIQGYVYAKPMPLEKVLEWRPSLK
ncbi:EAL domain-containing protein [Aeromonas enteropelogenes]|uniref:EAL domain-containing protein n=1 Tax=Aeromonas enteropelogenes TaxID=29489 RepID=UPI003BA313F0